MTADNNIEAMLMCLCALGVFIQYEYEKYSENYQFQATKVTTSPQPPLQPSPLHPPRQALGPVRKWGLRRKAK